MNTATPRWQELVRNIIIGLTAETKRILQEKSMRKESE
jgi:hypothetical protein